MSQPSEFVNTSFEDMPERTLLFGPPGTGKTTVLENLLYSYQAYNSSIDNALYLTYSKPMAEEARERTGLEKNIVSTMHSYFSHILGWEKDDFINTNDYINFAKKYGLTVRFNINEENIEDIIEENVYTYDDLSLFLSSYNYLYSVYHTNPEKYLDDVNNRLYEMSNQGKNINFPYLFYKYEEYKNQLNKKDYTDILYSIYTEADYLPPLRFLEIDEAQDLRPIMWAIINKWVSKIDKIIVVGDVNQSLYTYDGVNIYDFLKLKNTYTPFYLAKTYRLPEQILNYSKSIINEISVKEAQPLYSMNKSRGQVRFFSSFIDALTDFLKLDGDKWILARTSSILQQIIKILQNYYLIYGIINYRHRYLTPWNSHTLRIYNILNNYPPKTYADMRTLILLLPASVLRRGIKTRFQSNEPLPQTIDEYSGVNTFETLFRRKITRMDLINLLDLDQIIKDTIVQNFTLTPQELNYDNIIKVDTIHAAKGKEVDNVLLVKNITWRIVQSINSNESGKDNELRVHYVGSTRAKKNLYIIEDPTLSNYFLE